MLVKQQSTQLDPKHNDRTLSSIEPRGWVNILSIKQDGEMGHNLFWYQSMNKRWDRDKKRPIEIHSKFVSNQLARKTASVVPVSYRLVLPHSNG